MQKPNDHYDGANPDAPLHPDHFSPAERRDAEQLGDGSPAVSPRADTGAGKVPAERDPRESISNDRHETP